MIKHTPGPWRAFNHSWSDTSITAPDFDHAICRLDINHATEESQAADEAQMAANARLIAAAPDLLEALRGMLALDQEHCQRGHDDDDVCAEVQAAHAAIAKATGQSDPQDPGSKT